MYGYGYSYPNNPQGSGLMGRYEAGVRSDGGSFAFPIDTGLASRLEGLGLLNASSLVNSCNAGKESVLYNLIPTPVQSLDRFAVTRSTVKWVLGQDGVLTSIPANTPAFEFNTDGTYRGLLVEPAGTNGVRNNTMVGAVAGTPGTLPTNWDEALNGLTRQIVAVGTESGVDYVDIRFHGTATGGSVAIRTDSTTQIAALTGQSWTSSVWLSVIAQPTPPLSYRLSIIERTLAGGFVTSGDSTALPVTSSLGRFSFTRTLSGGATVERVQQSIGAFLTSGQSYDFTIRIGLPQMEQSAVATSVVKTSGTSLTRTADSVTLTGASSLIGQPAGSVFAGFEFRNSGAVTRVIGVSNGDADFDDTFRINKGATGTVSAAGSTLAVSQFSITSVGTYVGQIVQVALAYATNDVAFYAQGVQIGTDNASTTPTLTTVLLGRTEDNTGQLNGWIRSVVLFPTRIPNATLASLTA